MDITQLVVLSVCCVQADKKNEQRTDRNNAKE